MPPSVSLETAIQQLIVEANTTKTAASDMPGSLNKGYIFSDSPRGPNGEKLEPMPGSANKGKYWGKRLTKKSAFAENLHDVAQALRTAPLPGPTFEDLHRVKDAVYGKR